MSAKWLACCGEGQRADMSVALAALGSSNGFEYVKQADDLRRIAAQDPGVYSAAVGAGLEGISPVNLAASIARDGDFLQVVLVERGASGSLRSRAARAGVDAVIDPDDLRVPDAQVRVPAVGPASEVRDAKAGLGHEAGRRVGSTVSEAEGLPVSRGPGASSCVPSEREVERRDVLPTPPAVKGRAPVIVLCSGRGGVGKTCVTAALSVVAAEWGLRVCAVDLDLSCGNLYSCFGLSEGFDLSKLPEDGALPPIDRLGVAACERVRLLGPCSRPELSETVMPRVEALLRAASAASDLVLVDSSTTFTDAVAQAVQLADRVLIVSDGGPGSAAATARTSGLAVRLGVARTRLARLENRTSPRGRMGGIRPEMGLEAARTFSVVEGGDEALELFAAGRASELLELGLPLGDSAASVLAQVLAELGQLPDCDAARKALEAASPRKRSFFGRKREARSA